ncbi:MAG: hypothetical protein ACLQAT_21750 [Candidatus Binataceae bacterium]
MEFPYIRRAGFVLLIAAALAMAPSIVRAQADESDVPETSVVPSDEGAPPAPAPQKKTSSGHQGPLKFEVEPAQARVKLLTDTPVLAEPSKSSKHIQTAQAGKMIYVTGSTHYFLQVGLKSGQTGYIEPSAVELVRPTDKIFALTSDAAVLDKPNRWGKKLSEVHKGHNVHIVGIALNYMKIKMKSGLEGFVPMGALE